jgi:hypothetical protein
MSKPIYLSYFFLNIKSFCEWMNSKQFLFSTKLKNNIFDLLDYLGSF